MIWRNEFEQINFIVEQAVKEVYSLIAKSDKYIVFLSFGDYVEKYAKSDINPYIIDNRMDGFKDDAWIKALMTFLNSTYNFNSENTADSKVSLFFETMMYLHVWESRPYLRYLKRIASLIEKNEYLWKLEISDKKKSVFLKNQILPIFEKKNLKIAEIIKKGYVKQIRDAIAHNEYWHNSGTPEIILENYKPNPNRIDKLHYNEWTEYFCYTFLLAYHLRNYFEISKQTLDDEKCKDGFKTRLINKKGEEVEGLIFYRKEHNSFNAKIK
jgi:hypothetical protein